MKSQLQVVVVALLSLLLLTVAFKIQPARAVGTIRILPDGTIDPSGAPIQTSDKITYTLTADITESIIIERNGITVDGLAHTVRGDKTGNGFELYGVNNIVVKNTNIQNFTYGIYLESASSITLSRNNITINDYDGIGLFSVTDSMISRNTISSNGYDAIEMYDSLGVNITANVISSNGWFGIGSYDSSDSRISENTIMSNYNGIEIFNSPDTVLFHNNFINHTTQVSILSTTALWDNGCEGNYWSDYTGTDPDGDGIGNTPYTIGPNNADNFPLMNIYWNPCDINHDLRVDMRDVARAAKAFGSYPGSPNWNPHADITGSTYMVPDGVVDMRDIGAIAKNFGQLPS